MATPDRQPVIVSCAVTGGSDTVSKNPAVPVTPRQIAASCNKPKRVAGVACQRMPRL